MGLQIYTGLKWIGRVGASIAPAFQTVQIGPSATATAGDIGVAIWTVALRARGKSKARIAATIARILKTTNSQAKPPVLSKIMPTSGILHALTPSEATNRAPKAVACQRDGTQLATRLSATGCTEDPSVTRPSARKSIDQFPAFAANASNGICSMNANANTRRSEYRSENQPPISCPPAPIK